MSNFRIEFSNPWLLLLLIPAIALALIPYFRVAKKYRRTRNRVISVVLHCIVMVLCVSLLAGISFRYTVVNRENQIVLLVDASYSNEEQKQEKDLFVNEVIRRSSEYTIGIVKFGYDQKYVAEFSNDADSLYQQYTSSGNPDTSATDIASALEYAHSLLKYPETSKIVLLSDGLETDNAAKNVIRSIAAEGIKVDTVCFPNSTKSEVQIVGVEPPEENISLNDVFEFTLDVQSNFDGEMHSAEVVVYDNGSEKSAVSVDLSENEQSLKIEHAFSEYGLHELRFELNVKDELSDTIVENNTYFTYIYLHEFDRILMIEKYAGESTELQTILEDLEYDVDVKNVDSDRASIPKEAKSLSAYQQVILVNIANSDIQPWGFDQVLNEYVSELGGGLFTVGGENDTVNGVTVPHAYNRQDMVDSLYQQMLPVQVIDYTPPVAVMIIIDRSGSMGSGEGSFLDMAKRGADSCLFQLNARDYCGIMTLEDTYTEEARITPVSQRNELREIIYNISEEDQGGTVFSGAIQRAGMALASVDVKNRHILILTDGESSDPYSEYSEYIKQNNERGITISFIGINPSAESAGEMKNAATLGNGIYREADRPEDVGALMEDDLKANAVAEISYGEDFCPAISSVTNVVDGIKEEDIPVLSGYYGTAVKPGMDVSVSLEGEFGIPIYAQWQYGNGKVGSFMSELNGVWSSEFITDDVGKQLIGNIVKGLFPMQDIVPKDLKVSLNEDNYTTHLNVSTDLGDGDIVEVTVTPLSEKAIAYYGERMISVTEAAGYTRFDFVIMCPGLYRLDIVRKDANGNVTAELQTYKTFSYSKEYDYFPDGADGSEFLASLAESGKGAVISRLNPSEIFLTFDNALERVIDPRLTFLILAIVLFLLDIAVRKFKFKWPHEIVRDHRMKKAMAEEHRTTKS